MTLTVAIDLPDQIVQQLELFAHQRHQSVADVVREWVIKELPVLPTLPDDVEKELSAFADLWMMFCIVNRARGTLTTQNQKELASLNRKAEQRTLTQAKSKRQEELVAAFDRVLVRRAEAARINSNYVGMICRIQRLCKIYEQCSPELQTKFRN